MQKIPNPVVGVVTNNNKHAKHALQSGQATGFTITS
jgi:hypothetical protein